MWKAPFGVYDDAQREALCVQRGARAVTLVKDLFTRRYAPRGSGVVGKRPAIPSLLVAASKDR